MEKLIIFDCDGVLIDSEIIANRVFAETLTSMGYPISTDDSIRRFTGLNEADCRQLVFDDSGIDLPEDYWTMLRPTLWSAYEKDLTSLMQPVLEELSALNVPRCIASNSAKHYILDCLHLSKQAQYFPEHAIFSAKQVDKPKPSPELFLFAAKQMGFAPEDCIVIEDSAIGARAAVAAGMSLLLFKGASHARSDWYHEKLKPFGSPILTSCHEVAEAIAALLQSTPC